MQGLLSESAASTFSLSANPGQAVAGKENIPGKPVDQTQSGGKPPTYVARKKMKQDRPWDASPVPGSRSDSSRQP